MHHADNLVDLGLLAASTWDSVQTSGPIIKKCKHDPTEPTRWTAGLISAGIISERACWHWPLPTKLVSVRVTPPSPVVSLTTVVAMALCCFAGHSIKLLMALTDSDSAEHC